MTSPAAAIDNLFRDLCHRHGWKCTRQRLAVYAVIHGNYTHPGIDDIWQRVRTSIPSVTRESIYRILEEFFQAGLISRLDNLNSARYDSVTSPHCHFICRQCGCIIDYPLPADFPLPVNLDLTTLDHIELRLSGLCPACKKIRSTSHHGTERKQD